MVISSALVHGSAAQSLRVTAFAGRVTLGVMTVSRFSPGARLFAGRSKAVAVSVIVAVWVSTGVAVVTPGALIVTVLPAATAR
ncbi:MAG: hypothetical protein AW07_02106 [Candidatus Accumulibacter sp. SK-11]|nr:MAG: hypothetical protein AW07_02106 [Candidatus Accumulibacter sp. SK-11]